MTRPSSGEPAATSRRPRTVPPHANRVHTADGPVKGPLRQWVAVLAVAALVAGLLPTPAVSASENDEPDALYTVSTHEDFQNALNDTDSEVSGDDPLTILIDDDTTINTGEDGELEYKLGHDLVLKGDVTVTLDGGDENRILNVQGSDADTIEVAGDMTWQHGSVNSGSERGGAIFASGRNVVISGDTTFKDNESSGGGAIYALNADVTIVGDGVEFENNEATGNVGAHGGAVMVGGSGNVNVQGAATFTDNTSTEANGGAIFSGSGDVTVSADATFDGNSAEFGGGAIFADGGDVTVSGDATFDGNSADDGGAIAADGDVTVSGDATFEDNTAEFGGGAIAAAGGVEVSGDATFTGNKADNGGGGGIRALDVDVSGDAKFTDNRASGAGIGGAISADAFEGGDGGTVTVSGDAEFDGNTATGFDDVPQPGGAISATATARSEDGEVVVSVGSSFAGVAADEVDDWEDPGVGNEDHGDSGDSVVPEPTVAAASAPDPEPAPSPGPSPDPAPDPSPPKRYEARDDVDPVEPEVPEGDSVESEPGSGRAFVDGEARDVDVSRPDDPGDRDATESFVADLSASTDVEQRLSVDEDDEGRPTISGILPDPDDENGSRPVPASATTAVTSGDIGALVTTTTRPATPRDGADDDRVFASTAGTTGLVAGGLGANLEGQVQLRSDARVLGEFTTDAAGTLAGEFTVPDDMSLGDHTLLLTAGDTTLSLGIQVDDRRINGENRFSTATSLSQAEVADEETDDVDRVLIAASHDPAGGDASPDALGAAALAGAEEMTVLLVDSRNGTLDDATSDELDRLDPDNVTVLGGEAVIDADLLTAIDDAGDWTVDRLAGDDRYETAADLASEVTAADDTMIVASGESLVDALSAGALAAAGPHPMVLATRDKLPEPSADALAEADEAILVGGEAVLSEAVADEVAEVVSSDPLRLAGDERTATATALADHLIDEVDGFDGDGIVLANGTTLVDALTGARYAGTRGHPIVLANAEDDLGATQAWLEDYADTLEAQTTLGGEAVITEQTVETALDAAGR